MVKQHVTEQIDCPYCGEYLRTFVKYVEIEFEKPRIPPLGAKDLKLSDYSKKSYKRNFGICPKCDAKYSLKYEHTGVSSFFYWSKEPIKQIPNDEEFLEEALKIEHNYTNYKILSWKFPETEKTKCFIASKIFGADSLEVFCFKYFRDNYLSNFFIGRIIIFLYNTISPYIIYFIEKSFAIKRLLKYIILNPLFTLIYSVIKKNNQGAMCGKNKENRPGLLRRS